MIATASTSLAPDYTAAMYVDNKGADFISDETADRIDQSGYDKMPNCITGLFSGLWTRLLVLKLE